MSSNRFATALPLARPARIALYSHGQRRDRNSLQPSSTEVRADRGPAAGPVLEHRRRRELFPATTRGAGRGLFGTGDLEASRGLNEARRLLSRFDGGGGAGDRRHRGLDLAHRGVEIQPKPTIRLGRIGRRAKREIPRREFREGEASRFHYRFTFARDRFANLHGAPLFDRNFGRRAAPRPRVPRPASPRPTQGRDRRRRKYCSD